MNDAHTTNTVSLVDVSHTMNSSFGPKALPKDDFIFRDFDFADDTMDTVDNDLVSPQVLSRAVKIMARLSVAQDVSAVSALGTYHTVAARNAKTIGVGPEFVRIVHNMENLVNPHRVLFNTFFHNAFTPTGRDPIADCLALSLMVVNDKTGEVDADAVDEMLNIDLSGEDRTTILRLVTRAVVVINSIAATSSSNLFRVAPVISGGVYGNKTVGVFDVDFMVGETAVVLHTTTQRANVVNPSGRYKALAKMVLTGAYRIVLVETRNGVTYTLRREDVDPEVLQQAEDTFGLN